MSAAVLDREAVERACLERYEIVVGVEVHAQLATRTKLFCGCLTRFGAPPNTQTCPVCLGLPGALPVVNREAFELCAATALALGCTLAERTGFDRKNYYYPDQPKNYQISQNYLPLGVGGSLELLESGKRVGIENVHLEEDAGKLLHDEGARAEGSTVDLNRSGVPLAEIVSAPDMRSLGEVDDYMETLKLTLLHLGVSHGRMQEGNLRFEASISLRPWGQEALGDRVEIKNLNSTKHVIGALVYEIDRQRRVLDAGGRIERETRLWDDVAGESRRMRSKEDAQDYRYFPEPDLGPVEVDLAWRERLGARVSELVSAKRRRYCEELGLPAYDAAVLTQDPPLCALFEALAAKLDGPSGAQSASKWLLNDVLAHAQTKLLRGWFAAHDHLPVVAWNRVPERAAVLDHLAERLAELIRMVDKSAVSGQAARMTVLPAMLETDRPAAAIVSEHGLRQESDPDALSGIVEAVLDQHPGPVGQYLGGKTQVVGFLTGQCMRASKGKGNPKVFGDLLASALERRRG